MLLTVSLCVGMMFGFSAILLPQLEEEKIMKAKSEEGSWIGEFFYLKIGQTRPLFRVFLVFFVQTLQFLQPNDVKKCPSSVWYWDSKYDLQTSSDIP